MTQTIHFFEYLDYSDIEKLDSEYINPVKNEQNIYQSKLVNPIEFVLPKSDIKNFYSDDVGNHYGSYKINIEDQVELLTFLENLDNLCIDSAAQNSDLWFKKKLDSKLLVKYYNPLYEMSSSDDILFLPIKIKNLQDIDRIQKSNYVPDELVSVRLLGIEFFKQTFKWILEFNTIISDLDDSDNEEEEIDFNNIINKDDDSEYYRSKKSFAYNNEYEHNDDSDIDDSNREDSDIGNSDISENDEENNQENVQNSEDDEDEEEDDEEDDDEDDEEDEDDEDDEDDEEEDEDDEEDDDDDSDGVEVDDNNDDQDIQENIEDNKEIIKNECTELNQNSERHNSKRFLDTEQSDKTSDSHLVGKDFDTLSDKISDKNMIDKTPVINSEVVDELAKDDKSNISYTNKLELDDTTKDEITSIISEKKIEAKKYMLNAERAKRASQSLSVKAMATNKEISLYEEKLKILTSN